MPPARPCANPLFLQWLEELRDSAREKGLKTADVYQKGCRSLAACPIAYDRPRQLVQLQGIGPKTVEILEKKLKAHCEANDLPMPVSPPKRAPARSRAHATPALGDDDDDEEDETPPPPKKKKTAAKPKAYIPQRGSGPYGILIGLLLSISNPQDTIQVFLTKGELIRAAQPYSDSSYDHSERGNFATAWNGMKTLTSKGYVIVQGSPSRYCLTEDGYDVAATLRNLHPDFANHPKIPPLARNDEPAGDEPRASMEPRAAAGSPSKFLFWYIDSKGQRVKEVSSARMRLDPEEFVALRRIEFRASQRNHVIVSQLRMVDADESLSASGLSTLFAYILEDGAPPRCSCFSDEVESAAPSPVRPSTRPSLALPVPGPSRPRAPRLSSQLPLLNDTRPPPPAANQFKTSDAITFRHGSYEIVLVLDTREVESRSNRDKIAESLEAKGVRVETRALRMGDMCWVARRLDGDGGEEDECVLDYVIERKRLDDLCSSIRDGRYNEQCFRLSQSGVGNVFYVVEDWQLAGAMESHGKQIMTAKSQIQVVNGFFLKETHKLSDTIEFLAMMTRVIIKSHRDLKVIPSRFISRTSYSALQRRLRTDHSPTVYLTSFDAYQALNDKSAARTLREVLGRMLLCVRGMSPERVAAILDRWETPRQLYDAMVEREKKGVVVDGRKKRGPELFFADEVQGEGRRKIGDAQSKELWKCLWGNDADLDD